MDENFTQISFVLVVITVVILLLALLVVNLLLSSRNRKLRHKTEMMQVQSELREKVSHVRYEVAQSILGDVSRDLHDEVGQLLTFSVLQLENLSAAPQEKQKQMVDEVKKSVRDTLEAVRNISKGLNPDFVNKQGLIKSIEQLLDRASSRTGIRTRLNVCEGFDIHNQSQSVIIFRILRECLTNALKHAKATHIDVMISSSDTSVEVSFSDNGIGMNDTEKSKASLGWKNIEHYTSLVYGTVNVNSYPDKGTEILLTIPNNL